MCKEGKGCARIWIGLVRAGGACKEGEGIYKVVTGVQEEEGTCVRSWRECARVCKDRDGCVRVGGECKEGQVCKGGRGM